MAKLTYSTAEIMADHAYAASHTVAGYRLHGGFDAEGSYISPRTLNRVPAIKAWSDALTARGGTLIDATQALMVRGSFPNRAQQKLLLDAGLGETLWDSLTVTGMIEARGKRLAEATAPDFQTIIAEDISQTAVGHLNKGLLRAHGLDEGGDSTSDQGGHDAMWFAVRDMLFGKEAYPLPQVPESLARPEIGRLMPQIPKDYEDWILLLMNVLMIEIRAENFFSFCTGVMRDPDNFRDHRAEAMHAAELVDRIRQDEVSHVGYLTAVISELRAATFNAVDAGTVSGDIIIDPVWAGMVQWHTVINPDFDRKQTRAEIEGFFNQRKDGAELLRRFDTLEHREAA